MDEVPTVTAEVHGPQDTGVLAPEPPANAVDLGYTVSVEAFSGPLDLLLFLVRKSELDIIDIPVATIADQFVALISQWQRDGDLDLEGAGDFILLAATLLEIKARTIAPPPVEDQEKTTDEADDLLDPRADLIGKLLAYRKFKEAVGILNQLEAERALRVPRQLREEIPEDPDEAAGIDLGELDAGQLSQMWTALLARLGGTGPRTVMKDDLPIELSIRKLADQAEQEPEISLHGLFAAESSLQGRVSMLMATLECARQRIVHATQLEQYGDVTLRFRPPAERLIVPVEFPPEEGGKKRRRRPPLVTFQAPVAPTSDESEDPAAESEEKHETDEERFLRELNEQCDLDGVLARVQDVEKGFQQYWEVLHPPAPAPVVVPAAVEVVPVVEPPPAPEAVAVVVTAMVAEAQVVAAIVPMQAEAQTPVAEAIPPVASVPSEVFPPVAEAVAIAEVVPPAVDVVPAEAAVTAVIVEPPSEIPVAVIPAVESPASSEPAPVAATVEIEAVSASGEALVSAESVVPESLPAVTDQVEMVPPPSEVSVSESPTTVVAEAPYGLRVSEPEAVQPAADLTPVPETTVVSAPSALADEQPLFRMVDVDPITVEIRESEPVDAVVAEAATVSPESLSPAESLSPGESLSDEHLSGTPAAESTPEVDHHRESAELEVAAHTALEATVAAEPADEPVSPEPEAVGEAPALVTQGEISAPHADVEESLVSEPAVVETLVSLPASEVAADTVVATEESLAPATIAQDPTPIMDPPRTDVPVAAAEVQVVSESVPVDNVPVAPEASTAEVVPAVAAVEAVVVPVVIASPLVEPVVEPVAELKPDMPVNPAPTTVVASEMAAAPHPVPLSVAEPTPRGVPPPIIHRPPPFSRTLILVLSLGAGAAIALGTGLATLPSGMTMAVNRTTEAFAPVSGPDVVATPVTPVVVPEVVPATTAVVVPASRPTVVVEPDLGLVAAFSGSADQWLADQRPGQPTAPLWPVTVPWYACLPVAPVPASVVGFSETSDFTGLPVAALIREGAWGWCAAGAWMPARPRIVPMEAFVPDTTPPVLSAWATPPDLRTVPVVTFLRPTGWAVLGGRADHVLP